MRGTYYFDYIYPTVLCYIMCIMDMKCVYNLKHYHLGGCKYKDLYKNTWNIQYIRQRISNVSLLL